MKGSCGIRLAAEGCEEMCVDILTGFGLKGGGRVCCGESLKIELDAEITGDVRGPDSAKVGDVPVFKDETGKSITTSNINSVDGLTKITKSTVGEQKLLVETDNTDTSSNAGIIAKSTGPAFPYFELTKDEFSWRNRLDSTTGNYQIRPTGKDPILTLLPNGVTLMPWQPKVGATLGTTPYLTVANQDVTLGSNKAFDVKLDQDGYNLSAGLFFPGDGNGQGAYYTTKYDNAFYIVAYKFIIFKQNPQDSINLNVKVRYLGEYYPYRLTMLPGLQTATANDFIIIRSKAGEKITLDIYSDNANVRIDNDQGSGVARNNYLGIYMLG